MGLGVRFLVAPIVGLFVGRKDGFRLDGFFVGFFVGTFLVDGFFVGTFLVDGFFVGFFVGTFLADGFFVGFFEGFCVGLMGLLVGRLVGLAACVTAKSKKVEIIKITKNRGQRNPPFVDVSRFDGRVTF